MTWKLFSFTVICLAFIWLRSWWVPTSSVLCSRKRKDGPKIVYREAFLSGFSSSSACQWSAKTHPSRCPSLPLNIKHLSEASPGIKNGVFTPCILFGGCRLEAGWHKGEKSAFLVLEHFVFFHSATYNMGLYKSGEKKKVWYVMTFLVMTYLASPLAPAPALVKRPPSRITPCKVKEEAGLCRLMLSVVQPV